MDPIGARAHPGALLEADAPRRSVPRGTRVHGRRAASASPLGLLLARLRGRPPALDGTHHGQQDDGADNRPDETTRMDPQTVTRQKTDQKPADERPHQPDDEIL